MGGGAARTTLKLNMAANGAHASGHTMQPHLPAHATEAAHAYVARDMNSQTQLQPCIRSRKSGR